MKKENECFHEYISIGKDEEAFLKQKSRNQWLNLGDQNYSFFPRMVKVRNSKNFTKHLRDEKGDKVEEVDRIKRGLRWISIKTCLVQIACNLMILKLVEYPNCLKTDFGFSHRSHAEGSYSIRNKRHNFLHESQ